MELLDVSAVGLMLADGRGRLRVMASSTEEMRLLELFQLQNQARSVSGVLSGRNGRRRARPCRGREGTMADLRPRGRADRTARRARPADASAGQTVGALNLFHVDPGGLREADTRIGQALVDVATIGLIQVQLGDRREVLLDQLRAALDVRVVVEQAKGVLAEHRQITPPEAFTLLRAHARGHDQKLTQLAYAVVGRRPSTAELLSGASLEDAAIAPFA